MGHFGKGAYIEDNEDMIEPYVQMHENVSKAFMSLTQSFTEKKPTGRFNKGAEERLNTVDIIQSAFVGLYEGLYKNFNQVYINLPDPKDMFNKKN